EVRAVTAVDRRDAGARQRRVEIERRLERRLDLAAARRGGLRVLRLRGERDDFVTIEPSRLELRGQRQLERALLLADRVRLVRDLAEVHGLLGPRVVEPGVQLRTLGRQLQAHVRPDEDVRGGVVRDRAARTAVAGIEAV